MTDVDVRPSSIEGLGMFAARSFREGERIRQVNVVREITRDAPVREDAGERIDHCAYPGDKVVLCDYNINTSNGTAWPCTCGAARCRGEVVGDFFRLLPDRQLEYRPLLAAWFVTRHRDRIDVLDHQF